VRINRKEDQKIRKEVAKARYESRASLANKNNVAARIARFGAVSQPGLGGTEVPHSLIDRYYIRNHYPPRDILSELGDNPTSPKNPIIAILVVLGILGFFFHTR
jgi:hypothetical protein